MATSTVDNVIFTVAIVTATILYGEAMYRYGLSSGQAKKCATVPGKEVVSSTATTCTYASSYGRAVQVKGVAR